MQRLSFFFFGHRQNPRALWTLLPAHLQHYKELILAPEQCGAREEKRERQFRTTHHPHNNQLAQKKKKMCQGLHELFWRLHVLVERTNRTQCDKGASVRNQSGVRHMISQHSESELETHA